MEILFILMGLLVKFHMLMIDYEQVKLERLVIFTNLFLINIFC